MLLILSVLRAYGLLVCISIGAWLLFTLLTVDEVQKKKESTRYLTTSLTEITALNYLALLLISSPCDLVLLYFCV